MNWKLKDVLLVAVCAVLFGIVYLGCVYLGQTLCGLLTPFGLTPLGYEPIYGIWFMAAAFGVYVMRKPGTGIVAELLAAILETMMGNIFGPKVILSGLVQGIGIELVIALFRYKKFDKPTMMLSAVVCSVITIGYNCIISGYNKFALPLLALMLAVRIVSAVLFCGIITPILADNLAKAGVLKGYKISENVSVDLEA